MTKLTVGRFRATAGQALRAVGASAAATESLLDATLAAERVGRREVGVAHLPDYLASLREGRIDGAAVPRLDHPLPAVIHADARHGIAQLGFDLAFAGLLERARTFGMAMFTQRRSYTAGELGYYVRRPAEAGLVAIAATNAHAMMPAAAGGTPVFSTNPMAFGAPLPAPAGPLVIDQSSSATAFVNLARAAAEQKTIPEGWATDRDGRITTDPAEAMLGALLPFGGRKGANVALMVEILAAGLPGASWSLDAGHFREGAKCPDIGLTVLALSPPDAKAFIARATTFCARLKEAGVYIPGSGAPRGPYDADDFIEIDPEILALLATTQANSA